MDLQSVLTCPRSQASALYFKQKLQIHNFSFYDLITRAADLYVWHDGEGQVLANEFVSCIYDYICKRVRNSDSIEEMCLISDGCAYQNRNKILAIKLYDLSKELNTIFFK